MRNRERNKEMDVPATLAKWMMESHAKFHGVRRISREQKQATLARAAEVLKAAQANKSFRLLCDRSTPIACLALAQSSMPRIKNQKSLLIYFDDKMKPKTHKWINKQIKEVASIAPRSTQINLFPEHDRYFRAALERVGFLARYEILLGQTDVALKELMRKKSPASDLNHLGLELVKLTTRKQINEVMSLQKKVFKLSGHHGYFSHTSTQLARDKAEYNEIISSGVGRILGVYRNEKLLGVMIGSIQEGMTAAKRTGGFSFFLHPSIQGLGITAVGYRILLEYFKKEKVSSFYGGTSQPVIQGLGKVMKREVKSVLYVKMHG